MCTTEDGVTDDYLWLQIPASIFATTANVMIAKFVLCQPRAVDPKTSIPTSILVILFLGSIQWLLYAALIRNYYLLATSTTTTLLHAMTVSKTVYTECYGTTRHAIPSGARTTHTCHVNPHIQSHIQSHIRISSLGDSDTSLPQLPVT